VRDGVGAATLFRRFPTKEHLILTIVEERVAELQAAADAAARHPDPWIALERLMEAGAAERRG